MSYPFNTTGSPISAQQLALSIYDQLASQLYEFKYPALKWRDVIPEASIITEGISPGVTGYAYRSYDFTGVGEFFTGSPDDIPMVGQSFGQGIVPILTAAVGGLITDVAAKQYQYGHNANLTTDITKLMKGASERQIERTFFFGSASNGFLPFLSYPYCYVQAGAAWSGMASVSAIINTMNTYIMARYQATNTVFLTDTVWLPLAQFGMLQAPCVIGAGDGATGIVTNGIEYWKKNNPYTAETGKELTIKSLRYLKGAGTAGADRAIFQDTSDSSNYIMPFPEPYQLAQPVPAPLAVKLFCTYAFGSFHMPQPGAMFYVDGI
jgi:hypothetical protein